jgi:hypothetical protein
MEWGYRSFCAYPYGQYCNPAIDYRNAEPSCICRVCWWDIFEICGSGSPGTVFQKDGFNYTGYEYIHWGPHPRNSGEGAGTGGIMFNCCDPTQFAWGIGSNNGSGGPLVNWTKICQLGCCGWCDQAWLMIDAIAPFFITCAGTLGGSGGVGICGYTSKAGFGGGGGQAKCQLLCVCWGGSFDCCNGAASTPLAFPPCLLDILTSNAGTGLAIIYWREA